MSKYGDIRYIGSRGESKIEEMQNGHLHNAAKKLEAKLSAMDAPEYESDGQAAVDRDEAILNAMKSEIAERSANYTPPPMEDGGEL